jgi:SAM-dependent methyltransferase
MRRPAATEETACNLCGASDYEVVGERDREGQPLRTVLCRACGLVWTNPRPSVADMDAYYATEYRADYKGQQTPPLRKILRGLLGARDRRQQLHDLLAARPLRVLDVGCGAGEFVYLLRCEQIDASGLEPGEQFADFARRVLGIPVQTGTVDTAAVPVASLDLVTMFHALEHVPDPRRVLATIRGWLKPAGMLVVEVPNVESTVQAPAASRARSCGGGRNESGAPALGEAAGLRVVRTFLSEDGGNVSCIFRRDSDDARLPSGLQPAAARTRAILRNHTALRHYASPVPYARAVRRLRRRWQEDRLLRRFRTIDDLLRWAAPPGSVPDRAGA